jgi:nitrite reductase/ring-hydroxylating ferredoxin subunit
VNERHAGLLEEVEQLVTALESHPDSEVRGQVTALLAAIDAIHRAALTRLVETIRGMAGDSFLNRLTADPDIRLLLMSYDLVAVDRRLLAEEALDLVRGHLRAHGVEVELQDVVGGVVYVRIHLAEGSDAPLEGVRHDLEEALGHGLIGFQELVIGDRVRPAAPPALVQLGEVRRANRPVYRDVLPTAELPPGRMRAVEVQGESVLVANVEGEFYAVRNACGASPLPLHFGALEGAELRCSWHGCRYDLRSGKRLDGPGERLGVFPVAVEAGVVRVAVGVQPAGR